MNFDLVPEFNSTLFSCIWLKDSVGPDTIPAAIRYPAPIPSSNPALPIPAAVALSELGNHKMLNRLIIDGKRERVIVDTRN